MLKLILALAFVVFLIIIGPWLTIWAWNVLFGTLHTINFSIETWAAVIILGAFLRANVTVKRQS